MEVTYALTKDDIAAYYDVMTAYQARARRKQPPKLTPQGRLLRAWWALTHGVFPIAFIVMVTRSLDPLNDWRGLAFFFGMTAIWLLLDKGTRRWGYLHNALDEETIVQERTVRLDARGVFVATEEGEGISYWRTIKEIREDAHGLWFFFGLRRSAILVPTRVFAGAAEQAAFLRQAQTLFQGAREPE